MLLDDIKESTLTAQKDKDKESLTTLRGLLAEIHNEEIRLKADLDEAQTLSVVLKEVKKYEEAMEFANQGNRTDIWLKNNRAYLVLSPFLPVMMTQAEVIDLIDAAIITVDAKSVKDMGAVMKLVSPKIKGRFDGKEASTIVRDTLGAI